ncbi:MAG TPA: site-specific DNA-methyltransferase [Mogibacterium sp.]|nr:site-specific DNA-methyltransferase [Mogibacterium sp.]
MSGRDMNLIEQLIQGIKTGEKKFNEALARAKEGYKVFGCVEKHLCITCTGQSLKKGTSELTLGDNIDYMTQLLSDGYSKSFKLIYIDPPFFTKAKYNATVTIKDKEGKKKHVRHLAYDDRFDRNLRYYIENMAVRLMLMRELLADNGLIWVHLDWHSSHYVKVMMDYIFGERNFVNEIIWCYKSGGSGKRHFARKHDTLLVYGKTGKYTLNVPKEKSYNRGLKPYHFKGVKEYKDANGWYTLVNMKDVWYIDMVGRTSAERNGYATQKPIDLMNRIILASSEEGDLVGDFFSGSGSFLEAAENHRRRWIGCDNEKIAVSMTKKRLDLKGADYIYNSEEGNNLSFEGLDIECISCDTLESGKLLCKYMIKNFEPDIEFGYIQLRDCEIVKEALLNDTMQFIDYVMVDSDYNGRFSCTDIFDENYDNITVVSKDITAFIVVDIFGKGYFIRKDNNLNEI